MTGNRQRKLLGHNEVFMLLREGTWPKMLGGRVHYGALPADQQGRVLGYNGRRTVVLTEPITLQKGVNTVTVKASPKRPLTVETTLEVMEGRYESNQPAE